MTPLSKAKTQGAETATFSCPAELGRVAVNSPPSDETSDTRVTEDAPIISATPGPVEPALVSAACFPQKSQKLLISGLLLREDSVPVWSQDR